MDDIINYLRQATMESKLTVEKYLKDYPQLPLQDLIKLIKNDRETKNREAVSWYNLDSRELQRDLKQGREGRDQLSHETPEGVPAGENNISSQVDERNSDSEE